MWGIWSFWVMFLGGILRFCYTVILKIYAKGKISCFLVFEDWGSKCQNSGCWMGEIVGRWIYIFILNNPGLIIYLDYSVCYLLILNLTQWINMSPIKTMVKECVWKENYIDRGWRLVFIPDATTSRASCRIIFASAGLRSNISKDTFWTQTCYFSTWSCSDDDHFILFHAEGGGSVDSLFHCLFFIGFRIILIGCKYMEYIFSIQIFLALF